LGRNEAAAREIEVDEGESVRKEKGKTAQTSAFFCSGRKNIKRDNHWSVGPHCHMSFFYVEVGGCLPHRDVYLSGLLNFQKYI
jgi:hypothetical protein